MCGGGGGVCVWESVCMSARVLASLIPRLLRSRTEEPGNEGIKFSWKGEEEFL